MSRRGAVYAAAIVVAGGTLAFVTGGPVRSAPAPVKGLHAAYRGVKYAELPKAPEPDLRKFWFTGTPSDQTNRLTGRPSAAFAESPPTAATTATQTSSSLAAPGEPSPAPTDPLFIYWTGPYTGPVDGEMVLGWWWSSVNPLALVVGAAIEVSVWADPTPAGEATLLGRRQVDVIVAPVPEFNTSTVPVEGRANRTLLIQARPVFVDTGPQLEVSYGSADFPSGFGLPKTKGVAPPRPANAPVPYSGPPLELQALDIGTDALEPTLGVQRDGDVFMAAGKFPFIDGDPIVQAGLRPDVVRSQDGGVTWESVQPQLPGEVAPLPPGNVDPYVYVDPETGRVFSIELYGACSWLHYSDEDGERWTENPAACGDVLNDHQTLVAGPPPPGLTPTGYPRVVYYCQNRFGIEGSCARSLDGGDSFTQTATPAFPGFDETAGGSCGGLHGHLVVDSKGRIFLPAGRCGAPWLAISADGGDVWRRVRISDRVSAASIQSAVAVDEADNLYYLWWDGELKLPWLATSTDHGASWSTPRMIAPPGVVEVNFPTIDAGSPGHIAVMFPGTTQVAPSGPDFRPWYSYVVVSTDALGADPLFLSATGNDPADPIHRGPCQDRCDGMWDFLDVVVSPAGEAWAAVVDDCIRPTAEGETDCVAKTRPASPGDTDTGTRLSAPGLAVRQVGGPSLRVRPATAAPGIPDGEIPATGGGGWPPLALAAVVVLTLVAVARWRLTAPG